MVEIGVAIPKLSGLKIWDGRSESYSATHSNKRPMGHIAHLRKQFKAIINTHDYIITLIKGKKPTLLTS